MHLPWCWCRCYFHLSEVGGLAGYIIYTAAYLTCVEIGVSWIHWAFWHLRSFEAVMLRRSRTLASPCEKKVLTVTPAKTTGIKTCVPRILFSLHLLE